MAILVFLETSGDTLRAASLSAVAAARALAERRGGPVVGVVLGSAVASAAAEAARHVERLLCCDRPELAQPLAETYAPALAAAVRASGAEVLIGCATSTGKDVLPRTAALLQAGMASDIIALGEGDGRYLRPTYAGNLITEVEVTTPVQVISVRQTAFAAAAPLAAAAAVEPLDPGPLDTLGAQVLAVHETARTRPDLAEADIVVSGGRGMKAGENFKILEELTDLLGGALGASRAACDAGMVPNDLQVGQTGKVVAPRLYIAVAISGAVQHLAGMKNSKTIVAINKDPEAPIFQVADYGLVATWEKAVPELIAAVKQLKGG